MSVIKFVVNLPVQVDQTVAVQQAGTNVDLFTDATGTTPATNPVTVTTAGQLTFFAESGSYSLRYTDANSGLPNVRQVTGAPVTGSGAVVVVEGNPADQDVVRFNATTGEWEPHAAGGGTGVVESIVPGRNITVDATDPANPIVASSGGSSVGVATYDFDFTQAVALAAGVDTGIAIPANSLILSAAVRVGTAFDTSIAAVGLAEDQAGAVAAAASGFDGLITGGITVADTALNDCPHTLVANSAYNQTAGMTYTDALTEWWLALNMNAETPAAGAATVTIVYLPI